jgi:1-acyl-sn-glycerol-3-phosphate acyltransferase
MAEIPVSNTSSVTSQRPTVAGVWALLAFTLLTLMALLVVLLTPGARNRSMVARWAARAFLWASGIRLHVHGIERLPHDACIVVANHASYLDGVIIKAALPARFSFVIKKEVLKVPLMGWFLRLIGSEFVDRFNRHSGAMDTRRLMRAAANGQSFGFFPEGTIPSEIGIASFHPGAFMIAARSQLPVVPVSIEGARAAFPLGTIWLKPGRVTVSVLETIPVPADGSRPASDLRSVARARIVAAVGEPDLAPTSPITRN